VAQVVECAANPGVTPSRILTGHPHDQLFDSGGCPGATNLPVLAAVILLRDQPPVPPKQGVWCRQGSDLEEPFSADRPGLRCQTTALTICEKQTLSTQLLEKYAVLFLQVLDHVLLAAIYPSGEHQHQEFQLQRVHGAEPT